MNSEKKPLYRRKNKKALHYYPSNGRPESHFRHDRNTKRMKSFEGNHLSMQKLERGLDYTPLYKFLLSKVGCKWNEVFSEAVSRLDKQDPVFYMVSLHPEDDHDGIVRIGESSYYSALTVKDGILVKINAQAKLKKVYCSCCTHTFNGEVVHLTYSDARKTSTN